MDSSAESLFKKANGKTKGMWGMFADYDGALELFMKSAAQFKVQGDYIRSAEAYLKAGECAVKTKDTFQIAENYQEAAMMFLKASSPKFEDAMNLAVQSLIDNNRLSRAADIVMKAGDSYRSMGQLEKALSCYQRAEKYYHADGQLQKGMKCKQTQADIFSEQQQYDKALPIYEEIAKSMLAGPLKFQAGDYHVKATLCRLSMILPDDRLMGVENCKEQFEIYAQQNVYLQGSREEEILNLLFDAVGNEDMDKFEEALLLLQQLKMLDEWKTSVLLVIKENMQSIL